LAYAGSEITDFERLEHHIENTEDQQSWMVVYGNWSISVLDERCFLAFVRFDLWWHTWGEFCVQKTLLQSK